MTHNPIRPWRDIERRKSRQIMVGNVPVGGGAGSGMVYLAGRQDHKLSNERMIDHIVELVEERAAKIEAEKAEATE